MLSKIKTIDKVLFAKHLSLMLSSGVSLQQSIIELQDQASPSLKKILKTLGEEIKKGSTVSKALSKYEKSFGALFINMIRIGEESGTLEESLKHLASQLEASYELKKKVKGAKLKFLTSKNIGVLISIKPGQNQMKKALKLKQKYKNKEFYFLIADTISFTQLENFPFIDCFINTACPRISFDDSQKIGKPIINIEDIE